MSDIKTGVFKPRICKKPNCNNPIGKLNKTGLCRPCYAKDIHAPRMVKRRRELKRIREGR